MEITSTPIVLIFRTDAGDMIEWPPEDLVESGTPIDDDGEDAVYVGWRYL